MTYLLEMEHIIKTIEKYVKEEFKWRLNIIVKRASPNCFQINYRGYSILIGITIIGGNIPDEGLASLVKLSLVNCPFLPKTPIFLPQDSNTLSELQKCPSILTEIHKTIYDIDNFINSYEINLCQSG
jgi:hypothetical protein